MHRPCSYLEPWGINIYTYSSGFIEICACMYTYITNICMSGCQIYGPLLGPRNTRCRNVLRTPKGTMILTTAHIYAYIHIYHGPVGTLGVLLCCFAAQMPLSSKLHIYKTT